MRVMLLLMEFPHWWEARPWAYTGSFGLVEGLAAHGVETFILPVFGRMDPRSPCSWLSRAEEICRDKQFDQVWVWLVHVPYDEAFLDWLSGLAPVRVGWVCESLEYEPHEYAEYPELVGRWDRVVQQMRGLTHVVAVDERDVERINAQGIARAVWWPPCVPQRFVFSGYAPPADDAAAFYGGRYPKRQGLLGHPEVQGLLALPQPPEDGTDYPGRFDEIHRVTMDDLQSGRASDEQALNRYVDALRSIRQNVFCLWMESLRRWNAIVNPPAYVKAYAGRVIEAMAAGRPVIASEIPNRPRTKALFEDGREILLFDGSNPAQLAERIRSIQRDPDEGRRIAGNVREKVLRYHTAEVRVRQVLDWVQTGAEPNYGAQV